MPIFPIQCEGEDRNLDQIRRENYFKSKEEPYPSHYLLRNCEEPEVLKMLSQKAGVHNARTAGRQTGGRKDQKQLVNSIKNPRNAKSAAKSFASTANTGARRNAAEQIFQEQSNARANKSEMIDQAWKDPQLAR